jgi:WhiB family redox-sensing transcriptional regulator
VHPDVIAALMTPGDWPLTVDELLPRPAWHRNAACRGMGPALFFPTHGETAAGAKAICAGCMVRPECLEEALDDETLQGIWGGTTDRERRQIRREHGAPEPELVKCRWCRNLVRQLTGSGLCRPCDKLQGTGYHLRFRARRRRPA